MTKTSRRRIFVACAWVLPLMLGVGFAGFVGWFSEQQPWEVATGWNRIPADLRPELPSDRHAATPDSATPSIYWLGHSGFVIDWKGSRILIDPNTSDHCTLSKRVLEPALDVAELGPVDAVLLSHPHYDHLDLGTLENLVHIETLVVPSGSEDYFWGPVWVGTDLVPLEPQATTRVGELEIIAVQAAHNGSRNHPFESHRSAVGYVIRTGAEALYYSGDTGFDIDFAWIGKTYRPRIAILPIGAYAPRFPMKYYHLSPEESVAAALALNVETVIPCHFGTFTLSLDRPSSALPRFARAARAKSVRWAMPELLVDSHQVLARGGSSRPDWTVREVVR